YSAVRHPNTISGGRGRTTGPADVIHAAPAAIGLHGRPGTRQRPSNYRPGTCILRSAQFLRSATVNRSRKGFALIIFSRLVRPVASAVAITKAASAFSIADRIATAPAPPAK